MRLKGRTELGGTVGSNIPGVGRGKGPMEKNVTVTLGVRKCSAHMIATGGRYSLTLVWGIVRKAHYPNIQMLINSVM